MKYGYIVFTAGLLFVLSGCSLKYSVAVESINNRQQLQDKTFILAAGNKDVKTNDLQFQEYACQLASALEHKGYRQVDSGNISDAAIEIFLSYGVGDPQKHEYAYTEPVWGQVGTNIRRYATVERRDDGRIEYYSHEMADPEYGITGYVTRTREYTSYTKFIVIDAYSLKERDSEDRLKPLWKTTITFADSSPELRRYFPYMITAAYPHIGENTGRAINVTIDKDSELISEICGISFK